MTSLRAEEEWIPISALQHYVYCPRQCALIHVAQIFEENLFTLRGQTVHKRVEEADGERCEGVRVERNLPIWSRKYRLTGKADLVEFGDGTVRPVEYKSGKMPNRHGRDADRVQLCAQALCLEEMFDTQVAEGDLYYAGSRRRTEVQLTTQLREETVRVAGEVRQQLEAAELPSPVDDARCPDCSVKEACVPAAKRLTADRLSQYLGTARCEAEAS